MSSVKPMKTLKGVFEVPKVTHRRDFLRENKLSLREMQRIPSKVKQQQESQEKNKRQQQYHQQKQQLYMNRRSASQIRLNPPSHQGQQQNSVPIPMRAVSQHSISKADSQDKFGITTDAHCPCCAGGNHKNLRTAGKYNDGLSNYMGCDKQIQTEDICDEQFLYDALKKCSANEPGTYKNDYDDDDHISKHSNYPHEQLSDPNFIDQEVLSVRSNHRQNYAQDNISLRSKKQEKQYDNQSIAPSIARSHISHISGRSNRSHHTMLDNDLNNNMDNLALEGCDNEGAGDGGGECASLKTVHSRRTIVESQYGPEIEQRSRHGGDFEPSPSIHSARSRQSVCSKQSQQTLLSQKKSGISLHSTKSRDEVRLPRYLEREKREKEEQRLREISRDLNCPIDHYLMTDNERLQALSSAERKFKLLINELNRMPMTNETLRLRNRKAEIDKELSVLEQEIRLFSKPKVYKRIQE